MKIEMIWVTTRRIRAERLHWPLMSRIASRPPGHIKDPKNPLGAPRDRKARIIPREPTEGSRSKIPNKYLVTPKRARISYPRNYRSVTRPTPARMLVGNEGVHPTPPLENKIEDGHTLLDCTIQEKEGWERGRPSWLLLENSWRMVKHCPNYTIQIKIQGK